MADTAENTVTIKGSHYWWIPALAGVLMVIGGIVVVAWPDRSIKALTFLVGLALLFDGVLEIMNAIANRKTSGWGYYLASGILALAFGLPLVLMPEISARALAIILGIFLMAAGVVGMIAGGMLRRAGVPTGHYVIRGVVAFALGLATVLWPHVTLGVIALLIAIWLIVGGLLMIIAGAGMSKLTATVVEV